MANNARQPSSISLKETNINLRVKYIILKNKPVTFPILGGCAGSGVHSHVHYADECPSNLSLFPFSIAFEMASGGSTHSIIPDRSCRRCCSCIFPSSKSWHKQGQRNSNKKFPKLKFCRGHVAMVIQRTESLMLRLIRSALSNN